MDDRITIIEGPTPEFEETNDAWVMGQNEGPNVYELALTRLRTMNGPGLVERCHQTWKLNHPMYLHYRDMLGLERKVPIVAARSVTSEEGDVLLLWVRRSEEDIEEESQFPRFGPEDGIDLN
ncbi:MAG: hypothetical protein JW750_00965 [Anaerolineaceae bacterium]|nr:hypothetical protein [Anaerolineaceae bacterium]